MTRRRREYFRILKLARRYDREAGKFSFNIGYQTGVEVTPRTIGVAEAFGLGLDELERFVLFDDVELKVGVGDVVYVTGDSGSGKSVLLRAIKADLGEDAVDMAEVEVDADKPIVELVGKSLSEALELLSIAGLNDAFLFVRRFGELSDGQKYRFRIAKLIESGARWWVADEFCSVLDRDTATIVAFNLQKVARHLGVTVIVATTHVDLFEDLKPSVHVHKRFGKEICVKYYPNKSARECSLVREMRVEVGGVEDWRVLAGFHYRSHSVGAVRKIFRLMRGNELCGVVVYCFPSPSCFGRRKVLPKMSIGGLNECLSVVMRVVVHPKYRSIGLGARLLRETLPMAGTPLVEMVAVMAKYNPFAEKAGMEKIAESKVNKNVEHAIERLSGLRFEAALLGSVGYTAQRIRDVGKKRVVEVLEELSGREGFLRRGLLGSGRVYPSREEFVEKVKGLSEEGLASVLKKLSFLAQKKVYLFWRKP